MRLTGAEYAAAQFVMSKVQSVAQVPLTTVGSRNTGLATPTSDLDINLSLNLSLSLSSKASKTRATAIQSLRRIRKRFYIAKEFSNIYLIEARVPILEAKHCGTGLKIQIQTNHQPIHESSTVKYLNEFPSLRPLYIILRHLLEIRGLTKGQERGLSSYPLLMMIVAALKHRSEDIGSDDLASQLLHILRFIGDADLYNHGFAVDPSRFFNIKARTSTPEPMERLDDLQLQGIEAIVRDRDPRRPYLLSLQDPANYLNDLGKNVHAIKHIQATCKSAWKNILSVLDPRVHTDDSEIFSCLDPLVRANYGAFEADRSRIERTIDPQALKDCDYSEERIEADFLRRVKLYREAVNRDDQIPRIAQTPSLPIQID